MSAPALNCDSGSATIRTGGRRFALGISGSLIRGQTRGGPSCRPTAEAPSRLSTARATRSTTMRLRSRTTCSRRFAGAPDRGDAFVPRLLRRFESTRSGEYRPTPYSRASARCICSPCFFNTQRNGCGRLWKSRSGFQGAVGPNRTAPASVVGVFRSTLGMIGAVVLDAFALLLPASRAIDVDSAGPAEA